MTKDRPTKAESKRPEQRHEPPGIDSRRLSIVAGALVVMIIACAVVSYAMLRGFHAPSYPPVEIGTPPAALTAHPQASLREYRRQAQARLDSLGWVDRSAGIAHIPIDRAIDLVAEHAARDEKADDADAEGGASAGASPGR